MTFLNSRLEWARLVNSHPNIRSQHLSMGRKLNRAYLVITLCGTLGVILGGTASRAELNQCLTAEVVTDNCLTQNPVVETIEGMGVGLVAGAGAAVGATWQLWRRDT